jgi:signal transduction histidine kinase
MTGNILTEIDTIVESARSFLNDGGDLSALQRSDLETVIEVSGNLRKMWLNLPDTGTLNDKEKHVAIHDLRNPLNALVGLSDLMNIHKATLSPHQQHELQTIRAAVAEIRATLDHIVMSK